METSLYAYRRAGEETVWAARVDRDHGIGNWIKEVVRGRYATKKQMPGTYIQLIT